MIYLLIFTYVGAYGTARTLVLPYKDKDDACYFWNGSESTPKQVFSLDLETMKVRDVSCAYFDQNKYEQNKSRRAK